MSQRFEVSRRASNWITWNRQRNVLDGSRLLAVCEHGISRTEHTRVIYSQKYTHTVTHTVIQIHN